MKIISHRGYWLADKEKNTDVAFKRSFALGFGTETDVRDFDSKLVISHDVAVGGEILFNDFLEMAASANASSQLTLAINIKSDGLAVDIARAIAEFPTLDCFVFDMSVPDMNGYFSLDIPVFTRMSEVERQPVWLEKSSGIWLDSFAFAWFNAYDVADLLEKEKRVCVVSPELHGRSEDEIWPLLQSLSSFNNLILCTDKPEKASKYFARIEK